MDRINLPKMNKEIHEFNRARWEAGAQRWAECADRRGLWKRCPTEPNLVLSERELYWLKAIQNKNVCVLGSGDNQVVFALAGLGAHVTSVDISESQLEIAKQRAEELKLSIEFIRADVTDLSEIPSDRFDLVYTGGHVAVWVSDIEKYYSEAARILKTNGPFIVSEYHPFRRIWKDSKTELIVGNDYYNQGPYEYLQSDDILRPDEGKLKTYEFHWTFSDYLNAMIKSGCEILELDEFGNHVGDWEGAPLKGLPELFMAVGRKK